jgi:FkbM family methyltransferase
VRAPILAGALRGRWWLLESHGKLLRVLLGSYEPEQTRRFLATLRPGDSVLDVGANAGYYTLLAAARVGPGGNVWAFEPSPRNAAILRRHVALNRLGRVRVEEAAASDREGTACFDGSGGSGTGHLAEQGGTRVRTLRLDDYCAEHGIVPRAVKIDVEGAEGEVLAGFESTLAAARPYLFLSTHGQATHRRCVEWLQARGYALEPLDAPGLEEARELFCSPA